MKNTKNSWILLLFLQVIVNIIIIFDIPVARQITSFAYLSILPGWLLVKIFGLNKFNMARKALFSVGLSVFALMFLGLLMNELLPIFGITHPLSTFALTVGMNIMIFALYVACYSLRRDLTISLKVQKYSFWIIILVCLPLLSITGTYVVNSGGQNIILLFLLLVIPGILLSSFLFHKPKLPSQLHPVVLLAITMALLFSTSLITNHINGNDIYGEFFVFRLTDGGSFWNSSSVSANIGVSKENAMLSVTILPTFYSQVLNIDDSLLFKILYPFVLSWIVVGLYYLYSTQWSGRTSFLSTIFFISNSVFLKLFASRQMIGELFLVLLFLVLFEKGICYRKKNLLYIIFGVSLAVSHYSLSYVFMIFISIMWIFQLVTKKAKMRTRTFVGIRQVLIFFVFIFSWYIFTSGGASFESLINTTNFILRTFNSDFFNPQSRGGLVIAALGGEAPTLFNQLGRFFFYIAEFFIVIGFLALLRDRTRASIDYEYILLAFANLLILVSCIIVPNFSSALQMNRFLQITLLLLAPLCILGGKTVLNLLLGQRAKFYYSSILFILFLTPFFWFQSGFIYELTGTPQWSLSLDYQNGKVTNTQLYDIIVSEQEVMGAIWLNEKTQGRLTKVYADWIISAHVLNGYGMISREKMEPLSNVSTVLNRLHVNSFLYLGQRNTVEGIIRGSSLQWNITDFSSPIKEMNSIYSNGDCKIYISRLYNGT